MPIKDLLKDGEHRFERLGSIRLGVKVPVVDKKTGKQKKDKHGHPLFRPVATEYFVVPGEVAKVVGTDKPTELVIFLPFDEPDRVFDAYHRLYSRSSLVCRGNGEHVNYCIEARTGEVLVKSGLAMAQFTVDGHTFEAGQPVPCPGFRHDLYERCQDCRAVANLRVMVRGLYRLGYWQISTGSINSMLNIMGTMDWTLKWFGQLTGIPFVLRLEPEEIACPMEINGKKVRRKQIKHIMHLEVDPEWVEARIRKAQIDSLPKAERPLALPRPQATVAEVEDKAEGGAEGMPEIFDNGDVVEAVIEDVPPVVEDAIEENRASKNGGDHNGFWKWVYADYAKRMGCDSDTARAAGQKALKGAGDDVTVAMWTLGLEAYALTEDEAISCLGQPLQGWLNANEGKAVQDALAEVLAVAGKG